MLQVAHFDKLRRGDFLDTSTADSVTIDPNKMKITPQASVAGLATATSFKNAGKWYFEYTISHTGANGDSVGIIAKNGTKTQVTATAQTNCALITANPGTVISERKTTSSSLGARASGDVIGVAIDLDNDRIWFRVAPSGNWNGSSSADPVSNVGGVSIEAYAQTTMAPFVVFRTTSFGAGGTGIMNLGTAAFTGAVPAGYNAGWFVGTNSPDTQGFSHLNSGTSVNTDLDDGALVGQHNSATLGGSDAATYKNSGKYYFEGTIQFLGSNSDVLGLKTTGATFGNVITNGTNCAICYLGANSIWSNNANSGKTIGVRATGDVVGIAIDFTNSKIWFRVAPSGNWNGTVGDDPATNTGGVSTSSFSATTMAPIVAFNTSTSSVLKLNLGNDKFVGLVPAGFTAGWPSP